MEARINTKAHFTNGAICINGEGPEADEETKKKLLEVLDHLNEADIAVRLPKQNVPRLCPRRKPAS